MMIRHKFSAQATQRDGHKFPSKKEARYYDKLMLLQLSGKVLFFLRQVPFHLPGGVKLVIDFEIFWADGRVEFVDTKGFKTESYKAKKRMVEAIYPIEIKEA